MIKPGRAPDYRDRDYAIRRRPEPTRFEVLKDIVARHLNDRPKALAALAEIHRDKLYKKEYGTFEAFCLDEYGMSRSYAYRLLEAENVKGDLKMSPNETEISNENQARALANVPKEKRVNVLERAAKSGRVTAKSISEAADEIIDVEVTEKTQPKHCTTCTCGDSDSDQP